MASDIDLDDNYIDYQLYKSSTIEISNYISHWQYKLFTTI